MVVLQAGPLVRLDEGVAPEHLDTVRSRPQRRVPRGFGGVVEPYPLAVALRAPAYRSGNLDGVPHRSYPLSSNAGR